MEFVISRFIMIKFPSKAATLCTVERCKIVLFLGFGKINHSSSQIRIGEISKILSNIVEVPPNWSV